MDTSSETTGILSEKDPNSIITSCNDVFLQYAGVKSLDKVLGHTDIEFPWSQYAALYRKHELDALAGKSYSTIIPLNDYTGKELLFLHTKSPKVDQEGRVIGVRCHAVEIVNPNIMDLVRQLLRVSPSETQQFSLNSVKCEIQLSKRQKEVLFYLTRGKTSKMIAKILSLSVRTVEYYIENIKEKFNCRTKSELICCALKNGFHEFIPSFYSPTSLNKILDHIKS